MRVFKLSAKSGEGFEGFLDFLAARQLEQRQAAAD
jgi:hypothetical protein